ncbi:4-coumarate-CoA ligase [Phyllosticta citribraziliensis]|uniref:4-coumarate-CoA ligase n=1 Tax=Phyllosticta citribraziliensis TaxID=989973 RepID=A0ABR1MAY3_9PEZI
MPVESKFKIDIPSCNLLSYLFPTDEKPSDQPIWIDADDTSKSLSPAQLLKWVKRIGLGLERLGVQKGDVVLLYSPNHLHIVSAWFGIVGAGGVFSGCNPAYGVAELAYQMENTMAKYVLVEPTLLENLLQAAKKNNFPRSRMFLFSDVICPMQKGIPDWQSILPSEQEALSWKWPNLDGDAARTTLAALNYSSGTTGLPKGVMISHYNLVAKIAQTIFMRDLEQPYSPSNRPQERWLGFLPMYHAYGQVFYTAMAAKTVSPCYIMRSFTYRKFLEKMQNHRITHLQTAPPIIVMLAKRPETSEYNLSSLVHILCGAAPLSAELQNEVSDRFGVKIVQTWGMTELTCSAVHVPGGRVDRSGSIGLIDPNTTVKVLDDDGLEVGPGERGEVHVRGPNACIGYWRNPKATKELFDDDGFIRTGDIGVRDFEPKFWIVDRKKELIKVKAYQVAPAELEALLLENEAVADAAVVGLKMDHEEFPRAYVALKDHFKGQVSETDIVQWVAGRVAKYKQLLGGVKFVDEVPKLLSGKIQRRTVREWAARDAKYLQAPQSRL